MPDDNAIVVELIAGRPGDPVTLDDGALVRIGERVMPFVVPGCGESEYARVRAEGPSLVVECPSPRGAWLIERLGRALADEMARASLDRASLQACVGGDGAWWVRTNRYVHAFSVREWRFVWMRASTERVGRVAMLFIPRATFWLAPGVKETPTEHPTETTGAEPLDETTTAETLRLDGVRTLEALCAALRLDNRTAACLVREPDGRVTTHGTSPGVDETWWFPCGHRGDRAQSRRCTLREWITTTAHEGDLRLVLSAREETFLLTSCEAHGKRYGLVVPVDSRRPYGSFDQAVQGCLQRVTRDLFDPWNEIAPPSHRSVTAWVSSGSGSLGERYRAIERSLGVEPKDDEDAWVRRRLDAACVRRDWKLAGRIARDALFCMFKAERDLGDAVTALQMTALACHEEHLPTDATPDEGITDSFWRRFEPSTPRLKGAIDRKKLAALVLHAHVAMLLAPSWVEGGIRRVGLGADRVVTIDGARSHVQWCETTASLLGDDAVGRSFEHLLKSKALRSVVVYARDVQAPGVIEARVQAVHRWLSLRLPEGDPRGLGKLLAAALGCSSES